jgi:hypothetical protein
MKSKNTDPFSVHEAMDRSYTIGAQVDAYLVKHDFIKSHPDLHAKAEKIAFDLANLYQDIGQFM